MRRQWRGSGGMRGLSLLEVLVAMVIMTAGLLAVMAVYPYTLTAGRDAELLTEAAALAQMKAEEIRRDDSTTKRLVGAIKTLNEPSTPIVFQNEPRLSYSFCGQTLLYTDVDASDPRGTSGVARVIVRYAPEFRSSQDVIYELRFN